MCIAFVFLYDCCYFDNMINKDKNSRAMAVAINEGNNTSALRTLVKTYARHRSDNLLDMINSLPDYYYHKINDKCKHVQMSNDVKSKIMKILYS